MSPNRSAKLLAAIVLISALSLVTGVPLAQNAAATPMFQPLQIRQATNPRRQDSTRTSMNGSLQPVQIPVSELPPRLQSNVIFRMIASGGFAGQTYETLLFKDGRMIRSRVSLNGIKSEVAANRLSPQRVRQFEKLVRTHVKPFDRLSYPASQSSADFITVTASSQAGTVQYADSIQSQLPSSLKTILQAWNRLAQQQ
ncbi:MAG: hypothetical protein LH702_27490 [Phormidesmis sp. CAN_BIN44]|nr:hypothetical protein [Phormidesmis sp. CAN_BIN44]